MPIPLPAVQWLAEPEKPNYPVALSYLCLVREPATAQMRVRALRAAQMSTFKAKDIFRASGLSLLGVSNGHVDKERRKIAAAKALSPLALSAETMRN